MLKTLFKKSFKKSIWVYHTNTGACNGCDIEVINVLTPYYDAERFGIKLVGSPRYADALLVSGPVTRQVAPALKNLYESVPDPKLVIAVGSCAAGGRFMILHLGHVGNAGFELDDGAPVAVAL